MRSLVLVGLLAFATPALADDFNDFSISAVNFPNQFNVINLFMPSGTFGAATPAFAAPNAPGSWTTKANTGTFLQLLTTDLSTSTFFSWQQDFFGVPSSFTLSYQGYQWNGSAIVPGTSFTGGLTVDSGGSGFAFPGGSSPYAGPPSLVAPVPEPSSMLICGLGLATMGIRSWRRRRGEGARAETS